MKRLVVLAGMAAVLVGVAACHSQTPGNPTSTGGNGQPSDSQPVSPSSSTGSSGTLPVNDPCSLLSSSDLEQLGASSPTSQDNVGGLPVCEIDTATGSIGVGAEKYGLDKLVVKGPVTDIPIGSHQAKKMQETDSGGCLVAIGVTSSSRVDIEVIANGSADPCPTAVKAAQLVEPHLPASSG